MSSEPPQSLYQTIALRFGRDKADLLCERYGGQLIFMPNNPTPDHPIAQALGWEVADFLSCYGGSHLAVPLGTKSVRVRLGRHVDELLAKGMTSNEVARIAGCHIRTVYRHRAAQKAQQAAGADTP